MFKIAVLVSGNGSNLEALIDACKNDVIKGSIDIVISNNPNAFGIERAKKYSIKSGIIYIFVSRHLTIKLTNLSNWRNS